MSRQVITVSTIDKLVGEGNKELQLEPGAIVTALAAEYARERGFRLIPAQACAAPPTSPGQTETKPTRSAIKYAVVAALGEEPPKLDAILDRVLGQ